MQTTTDKRSIEIDTHEAKILMQALLDMSNGCYVMGCIKDLYDCLFEIAENERSLTPD